MPFSVIDGVVHADGKISPLCVPDFEYSEDLATTPQECSLRVFVRIA